MKIYFASDHAGFELKGILINHVRELGHSVEDCGPHLLDPNDDYPPLIKHAIQKMADDLKEDRLSRVIVIGASGQGEAVVANRFKGVRCAVYYGDPMKKQTDAKGQELDIIESTRVHNDSNALSLGARFVTSLEAKMVVQKWLDTPFLHDDRHLRRVWQIDAT